MSHQATHPAQQSMQCTAQTWSCSRGVIGWSRWQAYCSAFQKTRTAVRVAVRMCHCHDWNGSRHVGLNMEYTPSKIAIWVVKIWWTWPKFSDKCQVPLRLFADAVPSKNGWRIDASHSNPPKDRTFVNSYKNSMQYIYIIYIYKYNINYNII